MAWYRALRNARVGKLRCLKGAVVELDPSALTGKADNFEPCSAPGGKSKPVKKEPKKVADAGGVSAPSETPAVDPALFIYSHTEYKKF